MVVVVLAASAQRERKEKPFQNAPKLISALRAFSRDQAAVGRRRPPEISAEDLIRGGYLTTNDLSGFVGMELTFSTQADDSTPQMILAHARMPDGQYVCLLADGSVQQFSRRRFEEQRATLGQLDGAANRSQPIRSETNRPSAATGSGR